MATKKALELVQGKTWDFAGASLTPSGTPVDWTIYGIRGQARKTYQDLTPAWDWVCATAAAGEYTIHLGADESALIEDGNYVSDLEVYHLVDISIVYEILRLEISVLPRATK